MRTRLRRKPALFAVIILVASGLIALEAFVLSPDVRLEAVGVLESLGWDRGLVSLLDDPDRGVGASAGDALVRRGDRAVPSLIDRVNRGQAEERKMAAYLLGRIGSPAARPAVPILRRAMREDPDLEAREEFGKALAQIGRDDPGIVNELVELLATGDEPGRIAAAEALGAAGESAAVAVPALGRALKDESPRVRQEAAEALRHLGVAARAAVPALIDALADPEREVRDEVEETLTRLTVQPPFDIALGLRVQAALDRYRRARAAQGGQEKE